MDAEKTNTQYNPFQKLENGGSRLFGRSKDVALLSSICNKLIVSPSGQPSSPPPSEIIFLRGESGVGKSSLFNEFQQQYMTTLQQDDDDEKNNNRNHHVIFATGKFDQMKTQGEPYSAIARCFEAICDGILYNSPNNTKREERCKQLREELGRDGDMALLTKAFPKLSYIVGFSRYNNNDHHHHHPEEQNDSIKASAQAFTKFKVLCRTFLRAASKSPVVIFLDDLQWADTASLDVIKYLMMDAGSTNVLFVAAYRDDERGTIPKMELEIKTTSKLNLKDLAVRNLELQDINEMLATVLNSTTNETFRLSELVLRKTSGNPYFMVQYLELLYAEKLLTETEDGTWSWNVNRVRAETSISDNVLSVVTARIGRVDPAHQRVLHIASCLGFDFDIRILEQVFVEEEQSREKPPSGPTSEVLWREKVVAALSSAVRERLLEKKSSSCYRFSHDRVQQCVYDMIGEARGELHAKIGRILIKSYNLLKQEEESSSTTTIQSNNDHRNKQAYLDTTLLLAVDQLNRGPCYDNNQDELIKLVRLNVSAGKVAAEAKTAFNVGANYFRAAISTYGMDELWRDYYSDAFEAHIGLAECYRNIGNRERCQMTVEAIVDRARTVNDKVTAYTLLIEAFDYQDEWEAALHLSHATLELLGRPLPRNPSLLRVVITFMSFKHQIKKLTDEHWLSLPEMTDPLLLAEMKILGIIMTLAFVCEGASSLLPLCSTRILQRTLRYGQSATTGFAMSGYAMLVSNFRDIDGATRYGRLAIKLSQLPFTEKSWQAKTTNGALVIAEHWRVSFHELVPRTYSIFKCSLVSGDIEASMHAATAHALMANFAYSTLQEKADTCREFMRAMYDYSFFAFRELVSIELQTTMNLLGESNDAVCVLSGDAFDEASISDKVFPYMVFLVLKTFICVHLRNWDMAIDMTYSYRRSKQKFPAHFIHCHTIAFAALVCHEQYGRMKERKYKSWARGYERELFKISNQGAVTASALRLLLEAESTARRLLLLGAAPDDAANRCKEAYDAAIVRFRELQLWSYEALSKDRVARSLFRLGERSAAEEYLVSARDSYRQWGAAVKVKQIEEDFESMFGRPIS